MTYLVDWASMLPALALQRSENASSGSGWVPASFCATVQFLTKQIARLGMHLKLVLSHRDLEREHVHEHPISWHPRIVSASSIYCFEANFQSLLNPTFHHVEDFTKQRVGERRRILST
ncbi:hypothetical protein CKO18_05965 [Rhodoferax fermentans]|uniref:Uncharacterized protein n=1 Tax=Rhodoferax fermentans TaxID=28066 RepID=A0A1T1AP04_RHOFE|nr:hypothetical protein [Rhodoferax fermentans]OOV05723.1 hypothetical protein RF819_02510 [Rhodoferax fermentans]